MRAQQMGTDIPTQNQILDALNIIIQNNINSVKEISCEDYCEEYKALVKRNQTDKYYESVDLVIRHILKFFPGPMKLKAIGVKEWQTFFDKLSESAPRGVRVYYRTVKAMMNRAISLGYMNYNPVDKVVIKKLQQKERPHITETELEKVLTILYGWSMKKGCKKEKMRSLLLTYDVSKTGFYTGMRLNEIMNLRCRNVDLNSRIITVGDERFTTKSKKTRKIPISDKIYELLVNRISKAGSKDKYVFAYSGNKILTNDYVSKTFKDAVNKAGLNKDICFHSLRHGFGSSLVQRDVNIYHIKELMGHSSVTVTERYSHNNLDTLKEAIKKFN